MTIKQIKKAVDKGHTVLWQNHNYEVIKDQIGQYLIWSKFNDHYISLTNLRGDKLNGEEHEFFIAK